MLVAATAATWSCGEWTRRTFRFSLPRVIDEAESHFKLALDMRRHGLNRN